MARRVGVGQQMLAKLKGKLSPGRRTSLTLRCRETNLAALRFYAAMGFLATGLEREHYDNGEDAIRMAYRLPCDDQVVAGDTD